MKDKDLGYVAPPIEKQLPDTSKAFKKGLGCGCVIGALLATIWIALMAI